MTDPYHVLGVTKSSTMEDIKKSYRKLAKKYHPDLNPGNKEAEKKFKEVSHAFDLIGTQEARNRFDRGETDEQQQRQYEDFFNRQKRDGRHKSYYDTQQEGGRYSYSFGNDFDFDNENLFEHLFGSKHKRSGREAHVPGQDVAYKMDVDFRDAALGGKKQVTLPTGKKIEINIPAGIESGKKLRFKGLGEDSITGGPAGDAYIEINILPLKGFKRIGKDIEIELSISVFEATMGAELKVPTLEGDVLLKIPASSNTGTKLRIKSKGVGEGESRGHQIVNLKVMMPTHIKPGFKEAIEKLRDEFNYNPRTEA